MIQQIISTNVECVGTRCLNREGEPVIRSFFCKKIYQLINRISKTKMFDDRLELSDYKGLFSCVGFKTKYISFENKEETNLCI